MFVFVIRRKSSTRCYKGQKVTLDEKTTNYNVMTYFEYGLISSNCDNYLILMYKDLKIHTNYIIQYTSFFRIVTLWSDEIG